MYTNAKFFANYLVTCAAFLAGVSGVNELHDRPGTGCLERKDADKTGPASVGDATTQSAVLEHVVHAQVFRRNETVAGNELMSHFVMRVTPSVRHFSVQPRHTNLHFLTSRTATATTGQGTLLPTQFLETPLQNLGVTEFLASTRHHERIQTKVDPDLGVSRLKSDNRSFDRKADEPFVGDTLDDGLPDLGVTRQFAMPANADRADILESQFVVDDLATTTVASHREGERIKPIVTFETRIAGILTGLAPIEERLECFVQLNQRLLCRTGIEIGEILVRLALSGQPASLVVIVPINASGLPAHRLAGEAVVVESAMRLKRDSQLSLLGSVRKQTEARGFDND